MVPINGKHRTHAQRIFLAVFFCSLVIQSVKFSFFLTDNEMWANQIRYYLEHNPLMFDFYAAYGHPGTTLVELGSLFHLGFGLSYMNSLTLSVSLLVSLATAACSVLCYLLQPQTLWWFTTAFILMVSRFYVTATPPTALVMPLIVLLVLATCWLHELREKQTVLGYVFWGVLFGLSAATRLDIALLVGGPLILFLATSGKLRMAVASIVSAAVTFFLADPFLWFMPLQHIVDLLAKFTLHYVNYTKRSLPWYEWLQGIPIASLAILWFLQMGCGRGKRVHGEVLTLFLGISLLAVVALLFSKYQSIRYLFPLILVWEIFLPLYTFQGATGGVSKEGVLDSNSSRFIVGLIIPLQVVAYLFMFVE